MGYGLELYLWFIQIVQKYCGLMLPECKNHILQSYPKNLVGIMYFFIVKKEGVESLARIGTSGWCCSRSPLGGRLAMTLVATISTVFFFFFFFSFFSLCFFSVVYVSHRRSARIKKLISRKWLEMANNLGLDPFQDHIGHFGAPMTAILDFTGGAALQAVSECPRRR